MRVVQREDFLPKRRRDGGGVACVFPVAAAAAPPPPPRVQRRRRRLRVRPRLARVVREPVQLPAVVLERLRRARAGQQTVLHHLTAELRGGAAARRRRRTFVRGGREPSRYRRAVEDALQERQRRAPSSERVHVARGQRGRHPRRERVQRGVLRVVVRCLLRLLLLLLLLLLRLLLLRRDRALPHRARDRGRENRALVLRARHLRRERAASETLLDVVRAAEADRADVHLRHRSHAAERRRRAEDDAVLRGRVDLHERHGRVRERGLDAAAVRAARRRHDGDDDVRSDGRGVCCGDDAAMRGARGRARA
eukprot:30355-Pelagococcus_subviridis.AAC.6